MCISQDWHCWTRLGCARRDGRGFFGEERGRSFSYWLCWRICLLPRDTVLAAVNSVPLAFYPAGSRRWMAGFECVYGDISSHLGMVCRTFEGAIHRGGKVCLGRNVVGKNLVG